MSLHHLVSIDDISDSDLCLILNQANVMKNLVETSAGCDKWKNRILATLFSEPSTRTSCSFQAAMLRLGGNVISIDPQSCSIVKGESIEDTVRTLGSYCDLIAIRSPVIGSAQAAALVSQIPVINGGDGAGEHPTQGKKCMYFTTPLILLSNIGFVYFTAKPIGYFFIDFCTNKWRFFNSSHFWSP